MNTLDALLKHSALREKLMPVDIIKFLYQAEFGCGHLISDFSAAHESFCTEWDTAKQNDEPVFEPLGKSFCRINLGVAKANGLSRSMVMRMFFESAFVCKGNERLSRELDKAIESAEKGELKIDVIELKAAIEEYKKDGMPMISHTSEYREAYNPSYRVVRSEFCFYLPFFKRLFELIDTNSAPRVIIDGMAASGKTTLAALTASIVPCSLIHADSFFLPPELRTEERCCETGGLIHYERFKSEISNFLQGEKDFSYRIFNCKKMDYDGEGQVVPGLPVLIEGSYSTNSKLCIKPDLTVFLKTSAPQQAKRILNRSGKGLLARFVNEWIPAENKFFTENDTEKNSDFVFET